MFNSNSIIIEPNKRYSKKEIMIFLQYDNKQLEVAENEKLISFSDGYIYGVYFFQFLRNNHLELEKIKQC